LFAGFLAIFADVLCY